MMKLGEDDTRNLLFQLCPRSRVDAMCGISFRRCSAEQATPTTVASN